MPRRELVCLAQQQQQVVRQTTSLARSPVRMTITGERAIVHWPPDVDFGAGAMVRDWRLAGEQVASVLLFGLNLSGAQLSWAESSQKEKEANVCSLCSLFDRVRVWPANLFLGRRGSERVSNRFGATSARPQ